MDNKETVKNYTKKMIGEGILSGKFDYEKEFNPSGTHAPNVGILNLAQFKKLMINYEYIQNYSDLEQFLRELDPYLKGEITQVSFERIFVNQILENKLS